MEKEDLLILNKKAEIAQIGGDMEQQGMRQGAQFVVNRTLAKPRPGLRDSDLMAEDFDKRRSNPLVFVIQFIPSF